MCFHFVTQMVRNYPSDATVKYLVDTYDWYFLPVANPDGYDYTFTTVQTKRFSYTDHLSHLTINIIKLAGLLFYKTRTLKHYSTSKLQSAKIKSYKSLSTLKLMFVFFYFKL